MEWNYLYLLLFIQHFNNFLSLIACICIFESDNSLCSSRAININRLQYIVACCDIFESGVPGCGEVAAGWDSNNWWWQGVAVTL